MDDVIVGAKMEVLEYLFLCGMKYEVFDEMLKDARKKKMTVQGAATTIEAIEKWYAENVA